MNMNGTYNSIAFIILVLFIWQQNLISPLLFLKLKPLFMSPAWGLIVDTVILCNQCKDRKRSIHETGKKWENLTVSSQLLKWLTPPPFNNKHATF